MQKLEKTELTKADRTVGVNCNIFYPIFRQAWPDFFRYATLSNSNICGCCQVKVVDSVQHRAAYFIHAAFKNPKINFLSLTRTTIPQHYRKRYLK